MDSPHAPLPNLPDDAAALRALVLAALAERDAIARVGAQRCVDDKLARFEWAVLDWNTPSIEFYRSIGAQVMDQWKICRLTGKALHDFAGASS